MKIVKANKQGIKQAIKYLKAGRVVVYPTDTAYGLGVDATNPKAVARLYTVKQRERHKPVHVMVSDLEMAQRFVKMDKYAQKVFQKFSPGPITVIAPLKILKGHLIKLSAGTKTIGVRTPKNSTAIELVEKVGKPITTTSANVAGEKTIYSMRALVIQYRGEKFAPDFVLDGGTLPRRKTSTIVSVAGGKIKIFREGPVSKKQILKVLET